VRQELGEDKREGLDQKKVSQKLILFLKRLFLRLLEEK